MCTAKAYVRTISRINKGKGDGVHIGLIGGIGPAATVAYYTRLVAEFKNRDLSLIHI